MMADLIFKQVRHPGDPAIYVAETSGYEPIHSYEIDRDYENQWEISIMRPLRYLLTPEYAHNFSADMRFTNQRFTTLREAKQACQQHFNTESEATS